MAALGLAIMVVAGIVTLDVVLENTRNTDASIVGQTVANVDLGGFFTAGVLVGVAFMLGLMLLLAGLRRANRKRQERKELARSYEGSAAQAETLQEERDRLAAELEHERSARASEQAARTREVPAAEASPVAATSATAGGPTQSLSGHADEPARDGSPVYPNEPTQSGTLGGTATAERTRPSLKERLLGR